MLSPIFLNESFNCAHLNKYFLNRGFQYNAIYWLILLNRMLIKSLSRCVLPRVDVVIAACSLRCIYWIASPFSFISHFYQFYWKGEFILKSFEWYYILKHLWCLLSSSWKFHSLSSVDVVIAVFETSTRWHLYFWISNFYLSHLKEELIFLKFWIGIIFFKFLYVFVSSSLKFHSVCSFCWFLNVSLNGSISFLICW